MSRFSKNQKDLYTAVYSITVYHAYRKEIFDIIFTKDFNGDVHEKSIITDETTLAEYNILRKALEEFYGIYL